MSVPIGLTAVAAWKDLRSKDKEIPDWISLAIFGWALLATFIGWMAVYFPAISAPLGIDPSELTAIHRVCWKSFGLGLAAGVAVGVLMYGLAKFGGGDAKLLMALGAALGWPGFFWMFIVMGLAGGALAVLAIALNSRKVAEQPQAPAEVQEPSLPYAYCPAIALGVVGYAGVFAWMAIAAAK